jgi:hypothetical protein
MTQTQKRVEILTLTDDDSYDNVDDIDNVGGFHYLVRVWVNDRVGYKNVADFYTDLLSDDEARRQAQTLARKVAAKYNLAVKEQ